MNSKRFILLLSAFFLQFTVLCAYTVSNHDAHKIAEKIWKNECGGTISGLTWWNHGEDFGSFGIGHFIWYPEGRQETFEETFPPFLTFAREQGVEIPDWLKNTKKCPWSNRDVFYQNRQSEDMTALRQFLFDTRHLQAVFMVKRLEESLPNMISNLSMNERIDIQIVFQRLSNDSRGLYALIDYLNFKGSGLSKSETFQGQGWGLLQVLQNIPVSSQDVVKDFVKAAKALLMNRVQNSPPERNEQKWLQGWVNRIDTYLIK